MESIHDPDSPHQRELREIEALMLEHGLCGYYETEDSVLWGYIPCPEDDE